MSIRTLWSYNSADTHLYSFEWGVVNGWIVFSGVISRKDYDLVVHDPG